MSAAALLLMVYFVMHLMPDIAALPYANQTAAGKAWEYILTNAGVCVLVAVVGVLCRRPMVWPLCALLFFENGQRVACRLSKPIGDAPPVVEQFSGLCGREWFAIGLALMLWAAIAILGKLRDKEK